MPQELQKGTAVQVTPLMLILVIKTVPVHEMTCSHYRGNWLARPLFLTGTSLSMKSGRRESIQSSLAPLIKLCLYIVEDQKTQKPRSGPCQGLKEADECRWMPSGSEDVMEPVKSQGSSTLTQHFGILNVDSVYCAINSFVALEVLKFLQSSVKNTWF